MSEPINFLKIKIERARNALPTVTREAIDAVPWRDVIYSMRSKNNLNISQLEDLELETELVLCGLVEPNQYPSELANRMKISTPQIKALVEEMNEKVFKKIREELVKKLGKNKLLNEIKINKNTIPEKDSAQINKTDSEENTIPPENTTPGNKVLVRSILSQKLTNTHITRPIKTEYSLGNISKEDTGNTQSNWKDPYRIQPGE